MMPLPTVRALFLLTLGLAPLPAQARPVVLELFTSQSCSSCPPAEELLAELAGQPDLLPLGFHVTYWNRLGWKDSFSFEGATNRQAAYASQFGGGSFTPQLVVDGVRSLVGSRRGEAATAIAAARADATTAANLTLVSKGNGVGITVGEGKGAARILLVGFDRRHRTAIGRGENGGRTILQANVVRSLRDLGSWNGKPVTLSAERPIGEDVAVILQEPAGRIVGAARLQAGT
ncbi:DUF1223 domain-containing protein [Methylobacterium aerolatum]|uniref:DUF1223 domain-containing protein n=1 Tax=Methylobacterium aerolatum TaxID=418708 RepID=A0ABU0HUR9_9HYPH|nr:DUF1223 domain-containing protein [Methylobacterium aerolatum]MDQ0446076.1 hypothetical protein [Methylobacterium aerolatum]GJD35112.1 hypothetical protein FMGBMHLM_2020 [Methylobacterium aerolatum]